MADAWKSRVGVALALTLNVGAFLSPSGQPPPPPDTSLTAGAHQDRVVLEATGITPPTAAPDNGAAPVPDPYVYERRGPCYQPDWTPGAVPVCTGSEVLPPAPDCGTDPMVLPLWRQPADDPTADWELVEPWHCPTDPVPVLTATAFRELPLTPAPALIQPATGDILVNAPTILHTDPTVQEFTTTLLGRQIQVRATPARFTWTFADDTDPLVTTEAGQPYPAKDLTHAYTRPGDYTITLTTTWTGTYRPVGTTRWYPVTGVATTTTTTRTFTAREAHTHLVAAP